MTTFETLKAAAGNWQGTSRLIVPEYHIKEDSPATATVMPLLDGKFVRIDYTWAYEGPQAGSMLIGYQAKPNVITMHWIDGWHNHDVVMACRGSEVDGAISVLGSYSGSVGPDWGWRTVIRTDGEQSLQVVMYNITPAGEEILAVEANYTRA